MRSLFFTSFRKIIGQPNSIIVLEDLVAMHPHYKLQVLVAIEVRMARNFQADNCLREAVTQLISLNVENDRTSPSVVLTNLAQTQLCRILAV